MPKKIKKKTPKPIWLYCSHCGDPLTKKAAVLFTPPDDDEKCGKYQLCGRCWAWVMDMLFT